MKRRNFLGRVLALVALPSVVEALPKTPVAKPVFDAVKLNRQKQFVSAISMLDQREILPDLSEIPEMDVTDLMRYYRENGVLITRKRSDYIRKTQVFKQQP